MCHAAKLGSLPAPGNFEKRKSGNLKFWKYKPEMKSNNKRVAILTDIYGCNEFYQSFASHLARLGWVVNLMDIFSDLGELKELTREAAFERRHLLRDGFICDELNRFIATQNISAVVGFCLGANYVLELARRKVDVNLVGFYPFPAGLPNQDELAVPLSYMASLEQPVTLLMGDSDTSSGPGNIASTASISEATDTLDAHVFVGSGHTFLGDLESQNEVLKNNAEQALAVCEKTINR